MTATTVWGHLSTAHPTAHAVTPAGGDTTWRTACGRIVHAQPAAAAPGARRCARCVAQVAGALPARPIVERRTP